MRRAPGSFSTQRRALCTAGVVENKRVVVKALPGRAHSIALAPTLMSFIVRPYLGQAAAQAELTGTPSSDNEPPAQVLPVRATHRTTAVLDAIARAPRSSYRQIAEIAGLADEGQTSKLLWRLAERGVIENLGRGQNFGEPNAWLLTSYGKQVLRRLRTRPDGQLRQYTARGIRRPS
jgi:hypothetical protein